MKLIRLATVLVLIVSACSGGTSNDNGSGRSDANDSLSSDTTTASGIGVGGANEVAAIITIGSATYEVDGPTVCLTGGAVSFTLANGTDTITINHSNDVVLIRMTIDGESWVDTGSPAPPAVTGEGEDAVIAWSGEMSLDGVPESVSMEVRC